MNKCLRVLLAVGAFAVISPLPAQDGEEPRKELTADEQSAVVEKAKVLLTNIRPVPDDIKPFAPWKIIEGEGGSVRWGKIFRKNEISALVNVDEPEENSDLNPQPKYLSYFVWKDGDWKFQQFLGNAYELNVLRRKDQPSVFLQGSFREGRYGGENLSWYFDDKSGELVRTNFEDWGPFTFSGNYLICHRGAKRRAHDTTNWIYEYRNGKKGKLLARYHGTDSGEFDITFPDKKTGKWQGWKFDVENFGDGPTQVFMVEDRSQGKESELAIDEGALIKQAKVFGNIDAGQVFERLTGLDKKLLEETTAPPPIESVKWRPIETSGEPEIVAVLEGAPGLVEKQEGQRIQSAMREIVPLGKTAGKMSVRDGDLRGIWGGIFGAGEIEALVALGMAEDGQYSPPTNLYFLRYQNGAWIELRRLGRVPGDIRDDGKTDWAIKQYGGVCYLLSRTDPFGIGECTSWRYDNGELIPTGWPNDGVVSLSGETMTISSPDPSRPGPNMKRVFQFDGIQQGVEIGTIRGTLESGSVPAEISLTVAEPSMGKEVNWRIRRKSSGYPQEVFAVCRDNRDGRASFTEDATLEFDWGSDDGDLSPNPALFLWWRLTGTTTNAFMGKWDEDGKTEMRLPKSVKVSGLPEVVEKLSWPK